MTGSESIVALAIAALALYGLGIPLAWLLPAPTSAMWVYRIAVGPLFAIVLTSGAAWVLRILGIGLHPLQLVGLVLLTWLVAWRRTRSEWNVRQSLSLSKVPVLLASSSGVIWLASLAGYGLYLPNRDFKNHAYFVAQVALSQSSDPRLVVRGFPNSAPADVASGYPLGLHTLLGWALPSTSWNSIGVTAASAVLATSVTLPLAMVCLARMWAPSVASIGLVAGLAVVVLPGVTGSFTIGAVPLLVGVGFYASGLAALWMWLRAPAVGTTVGLGLSGLGLLLLHISEAVALALVLVCCLPIWLWRRRGAVGPLALVSSAAAVGVVSLVAFFAVRPNLPRLRDSAAWDIEPNTFGVAETTLIVFVKSVATDPLMGLIWLPLTFIGGWLAYRRKLSPYPAVSLVVALGLAVVASAGFIPPEVRAMSAPWYGAIGRVALLAAPAVVLLGSLAVSSLVSRPSYAAASSRRSVVVASAVVVTLVVVASQVVTERRASLSATLAGAGDTPRIAKALDELLAPGEAVLNFEGDGGAQLFATGRVPIVNATVKAGSSALAEHPYSVAIRGLARVAEPDVAQALRDLHVAYVVIGTGSLYWDRIPGYSVEQLLAQPEFRLVLTGTDMMVLRYEASPN